MPHRLKSEIKVLLADDHPIVREGARLILERDQCIKVIGEASDGESLCTLYQQLSPDIAVIDLSMPGIGGYEAIRRIIAHDPTAHILVFSMNDSETLVRRTLEAGAMGYLSKSSATKLILESVIQVAKGKVFIDPFISQRLGIQHLTGHSEDPLRSLSGREFQLFQMLAEGFSVSEIAQKISISPKTAGVHHATIMRKLGIHNDAQLVRLAMRYNIIAP